MHPILGNKQALRVYLVAWLPVAGLLSILWSVTSDLSPAGSLILAGPLALLYAFLCLAAWYLCRYFPLQGTKMAPLLIINTGAAVLTSSLWVLIGQAWAAILSSPSLFPGINRRFSDSVPVLFAVGVILFILTVAVHYLIIAFETSRAAERKALEMKVLARESELRVLKSQIDPHFLFNSLNSISALIGTDPRGARRMTLLLADFLRKSLGFSNLTSIPLQDELGLMSSFLSIEQVRFGPRLRTESEMDEGCGMCLVPPLLLQPLVENAVKHGIANLLEGGTVQIRAERRGERLKIVIWNPRDAGKPTGRGKGLGIANVRSRLAATYGREARLDVHESADSFTVELTMPAVIESPPARTGDPSKVLAGELQ